MLEAAEEPKEGDGYGTAGHLGYPFQFHLRHMRHRQPRRQIADRAPYGRTIRAGWVQPKAIATAAATLNANSISNRGRRYLRATRRRN